MKTTLTNKHSLPAVAAVAFAAATAGCVTTASVQSEIDTALRVVNAARAAGADQCDRVTMTAAEAELERAKKALTADQRYQARVHARAVLTLTRGTRRTLGPDGQCIAAPVVTPVAPAAQTKPAAEPPPPAEPVDPSAGAPPLP